MTERIRAIETQYAGCRFRSRLEARWAVFFDTLGFGWEYEPQGYETDGGRYLPDFWLPGGECFVEVKGVLSPADYVKISRGAHGLRAAPRPRLVQPQLLLLGPVPRPGHAYLHWRIDVLGEELLWQQVFFDPEVMVTYAFGTPMVMAPDEIRDDERTAVFHRILLAPMPEPRLTIDPIVDAAYSAARSARFEYGERG